MKPWQLQHAKARLSELVKSSRAEGPQKITVRGKTEAVVLSVKEYERLKGRKPSFLDFLRGSPLAGVELDLRRDRSRARKVRI